MSREKAKILLVDDHPIVFLAVKTLLAGTTDFILCERGVNGTQALDLVSGEQPDIVLLDLLLDGRNGLELIPQIFRSSPATRVVIYSSLDETRHAPRALRQGAMGYVMKKEEPAVLLSALRAVLAGKRHASEAVQQLLMEEAILGTRPVRGIDELSIHQLQVFRMHGEGLSVAEIATKLGVSTKTVHSHRERIKDKLNLHSGEELQKSAKVYYLSDEG